MNTYYRMNRLLAPDGKCLDVAIDHGFFNEYSFLEGIEDLPKVIQLMVEVAPDAIQLPAGTAPLLQRMPGRNKPSLVMRVDVANVYGRTLPRYPFNRMVEAAVEQAIRLDAVCLCVNLLLLPDQPELHAQCIENISRLKPECERYGMPLMVEPLVFRPNKEAGGYMVDGELTRILPLVRQAVELGADLIKADPCNDPREYHRVVEVACGTPVLVRGGGRVSDEALVERTTLLVGQGVAGFVYGRNVIQHAHPELMVRALMSILHQGVTKEQALAILEGRQE